MVFAAWSGKPGLPTKALSDITQGSYNFGKKHLDEIVEAEYAGRGITRELAERYLHEYIQFEIGTTEQKGLDAFLELAELAVLKG
jgi:predicted solute-binding protein